MKYLNKIVLFLVLSITSSISFAKQAISDELLTVQHRWAQVNYQLTDKEQDAAFKALIRQLKTSVREQPKNAENWIWLGIVQSSYAGAKGGLGALSLAKAAKKSFEKALSLDDKALDGSAYTSLGTLYYKVPGWPIGFGDDDKAKVLLEKALSINPQGMEPNYFFADYWFEAHNYSKAKQYLEKAQQAPVMETRPLADKSRRLEISQLMARIDKKLQKKNKKT